MHSAACRLVLAACAVRTLASTAIRIPMKPAASEQTAPSRKPMAVGQPLKYSRQEEDDDRDDANGRDLPVEVSLRALLDGAGDLLHPAVARRGGEDQSDQVKRTDQTDGGQQKRNPDAGVNRKAPRSITKGNNRGFRVTDTGERPM